MTARAGKWLYLVCTSVLAITGHGIIAVMPVAVYRSFGNRRLTTLMGLTLTSTVLAGMLVALTRQLILATSGWFYFLLTDALLMLLALVLVTVCLPWDLSA